MIMFTLIDCRQWVERQGLAWQGLAWCGRSSEHVVYALRQLGTSQEMTSRASHSLPQPPKADLAKHGPE